MSSAAATVHLIDDDASILKALKRLLTMVGHNVASYSSAEEFLQKRDANAPGCAVVDLGLPGMDGFAIQDLLASYGPGCPIVFLTGRGDVPACARAMKAGAVDFLTKPVNSACLLAAVSEALERDAIDRKAAEQRRIAQHRLDALTRRESQVMSWVVAGLLNKQIAAELGTVEKTVKVHRARMMGKMGVRNVADLVRLDALIRS